MDLHLGLYKTGHSERFTPRGSFVESCTWQSWWDNLYHIRFFKTGQASRSENSKADLKDGLYGSFLPVIWISKLSISRRFNLKDFKSVILIVKKDIFAECEIKLMKKETEKSKLYRFYTSLNKQNSALVTYMLICSQTHHWLGGRTEIGHFQNGNDSTDFREECVRWSHFRMLGPGGTKKWLAPRLCWEAIHCTNIDETLRVLGQSSS